MASEVLEHIPDDVTAMRRDRPRAQARRPGRGDRAALRPGADLLGAVGRVPRQRGRPHPHLPRATSSAPGWRGRAACRAAPTTRTPCTRPTGGSSAPSAWSATPRSCGPTTGCWSGTSRSGRWLTRTAERLLDPLLRQEPRGLRRQAGGAPRRAAGGRRARTRRAGADRCRALTPARLLPELPGVLTGRPGARRPSPGSPPSRTPTARCPGSAAASSTPGTPSRRRWRSTSAAQHDRAAAAYRWLAGRQRAGRLVGRRVPRRRRSRRPPRRATTPATSPSAPGTAGCSPATSSWSTGCGRPSARGLDLVTAHAAARRRDRLGAATRRHAATTPPCYRQRQPLPGAALRHRAGRRCAARPSPTGSSPPPTSATALRERPGRLRRPVPLLDGLVLPGARRRADRRRRPRPARRRLGPLRRPRARCPLRRRPALGHRRRDLRAGPRPGRRRPARRGRSSRSRRCSTCGTTTAPTGPATSSPTTPAGRSSAPPGRRPPWCWPPTRSPARPRRAGLFTDPAALPSAGLPDPDADLLLGRHRPALSRITGPAAVSRRARGRAGPAGCASRSSRRPTSGGPAPCSADRNIRPAIARVSIPPARRPSSSCSRSAEAAGAAEQGQPFRGRRLVDRHGDVALGRRGALVQAGRPEGQPQPVGQVHPGHRRDGCRRPPPGRGAGRRRCRRRRGRADAVVPRHEEPQPVLGPRRLAHDLEVGRQQSTEGPGGSCPRSGAAAKVARLAAPQRRRHRRHERSAAGRVGRRRTSRPPMRHSSRKAQQPWRSRKTTEATSLTPCRAQQLAPQQAPGQVAVRGLGQQRHRRVGQVGPPVHRGEVAQPDQPGQLGQRGTSASGAEPTVVSGSVSTQA